MPAERGFHYGGGDPGTLIDFGPSDAAYTALVHVDLSTAAFHVKPERRQMTRALSLPATKGDIYRHASLPSTHRPATSRRTQ